MRESHTACWRGLWFPVSYLAHATEEYCCGETFPAWISRVAQVQFTNSAFLWLNGIAFVAMLAAAWLANSTERWRPLNVTLAVVVVVNGSAHVVGSVVTASYSPGVVTGASWWLPLGILTLRRSWRELARGRFVAGAAGGLLAHAAVSGIVLLS